MKVNKNTIYFLSFLAILFVIILSVFILTNGFYQNKVLFNAIEDDDYEAAKKAVDKGAFLNIREVLVYMPTLIDTNYTPLVLACKNGNEAIVKMLLENGADIDKPDNYTGKTPLLAALHGNKPNRFSLALYLIEHGADINIVSNGNTSVLKEALFVSKEDNEKTIFENEILIQYLLEHDVDYDIIDIENALTYSAHYKNRFAVQYLIENQYYDVNCKDKKGDTALIVATKYGDEKIVKLLLDLGADTNLTDAEGKTALDHAKANNDETIILLLDN